MPQRLTIIIFVIIVASACSGGGSSGTGRQATLSLEVLSTASTTRSPAPPLATPGRLEAAVANGQVSSTNLESLKYYITDISICKHMTITGTGYSDQSGCISVYSADQIYDYDTFVAEDAALETEHFIDLMSASDLATLTKTVYLSNDDIGDYYYGKVDHYRPVKVTASIQLNDDTMVYTKAGASTLVSGSGIDATYVTEITDITTGPAQESIVVLPNGGSWFKFEKPFTLTADDIENETTFQMKLAFNPEGVIKAYNQISSNQVIQDTAATYGIEVPLMPFTPVIYRETETAQKESYLFSYTDTIDSTYNNFDFRLELYTVAEDASDSIYAADTLQLLLRDYDGTGADVTQVYRPFTVTASEEATPVYAFVNWLDDNFITGFTRGTYVGDTGTATFHVDDSNAVTMDVLLKSIETIEADATIDSISAADLNGRWIGPCTTIVSGSQKDIYDYDGGGLLLTRIYYADGACATQEGYLVQDYSIKLIEKATTTEDEEVKQINFIYNTVSLTPTTAEQAADLNASTYCGFVDWVVDEAKEVLGLEDCIGLNAGDVIYDIYLVEGTEFYFGDTPATEADDRPTTLGGTATASYTGQIPEE